MCLAAFQAGKVPRGSLDSMTFEISAQVESKFTRAGMINISTVMEVSLEKLDRST